MRLKIGGGEIQNDKLKYYIKKACLLFSVVFIFVSLYYYNDEDSSKKYLKAFTIIVPLIIIYAISLKYDKLSIKSILFGALFILCYFFSFNVLNILGPSILYVLEYVITLFLIVLGLIGLAIFYNSFSNYFIKMDGYPKIIVLFIFYIPCLIIDFARFMINEYKVAPSITSFLLLLELFLLALYLIVRQMLKIDMSLANNGVKLFKGKMFLDENKELQLHNFPESGIDINNLNKDLTLKNYTLSYWVHINQPEFNEQKFPILCYGDEMNPKPMMTYEKDSEQNQYVMNVKFSRNSSIKVLIKNQNWNYFVFNYNGSKVDLFLNGILERSLNLSDDMPVYKISDTITIGSSKTGLNGAIADVNYYVKTLSPLQILGYYRLGINIL
jgi:hypothetical protein